MPVVVVVVMMVVISIDAGIVIASWTGALGLLAIAGTAVTFFGGGRLAARSSAGPSIGRFLYR
jgi:hypothetical protein